MRLWAVEESAIDALHHVREIRCDGCPGECKYLSGAHPAEDREFRDELFALVKGREEDSHIVDGHDAAHLALRCLGREEEERGVSGDESFADGHVEDLLCIPSQVIHDAEG